MNTTGGDKYADVRTLPDDVLATAAWAEHPTGECGYCDAVRAEQARRDAVDELADPEEQ